MAKQEEAPTGPKEEEMKKKPTLIEYVQKMARPKFCPVCGKKGLIENLHVRPGFPFWDIYCKSCDFGGELEPDVPMGATRADK